MILPRMKQDFIKDFDELIKAFDNNVPFVISRYGDGEIRVLQKIRIRRSSGWSCLNPKTHPLAKRLRKSFEYHDPGYYKGILCPCCVENMNRWYRRHTNHPIHQLTFASIFIRANHRFFLRWLGNKPRDSYTLVSPNNGDIKVPKNGFENGYDWNKTVDEMIAADKPLLVAAGPLANVLVYDYWTRGPRKHPALDIGSVLDRSLVHKKVTRRYQRSNTTASRKVCVWRLEEYISIKESVSEKSKPIDLNEIGISVGAADVSDNEITRFLSFIDKEVSHSIITEAPSGPLSRSLLLNKGIEKLRDHCKIIVCTDIDLIIPPGLIEYVAKTVKPGVSVWAQRRKFDFPDDFNYQNIDENQWKEWLRLMPCPTGKGCWQAMHIDDWKKIGGWDARLSGWGGEDDVLEIKKKRYGIQTITSAAFPLMHINHDNRSRWELRRGKENLRLGKELIKEELIGKRPID